MTKPLFALAAIVMLAQTCHAATRVLILSGSRTHASSPIAAYLGDVLKRTGNFEVRLNEEPAGVSAETVRGYDAVVLNSTASSPAIDAFVRAGKGVIAVHGGEGCGKRHLYRVKPGGTHPISEGLEEFTVSDEIYLKPALRKDAKVIAIAFDSPDHGGTAANIPIAWTYSEGKGRVFHTALGHNLMAVQEPGFVAMYLRAVDWAANGKITPPPPAAKPLRALVVTGGHGYGTSFYTVFENQPGLEWKHDENAVLDKPFADRYDVLVLYNMTDQISDSAKKNLVDWVEAGKGVVALHHALFNYRRWPWWFEVTGARPLPKEKRPPGPGYLHDVELVIESAARHPITDGLTPMHLIDETYKGIEWSPKAQILLKTNHPTSDGPVAWIGPNSKYRVVTIQLGHDHMSHLRADFRTLVHRAILWSAGKL